MAEHGRAPKQHDLSTQDLAEAAKLLDQELDRQERLYAAVHRLRERCGASVHAVLDELTQLDARRTALAQEIGTLEARLVELKGGVAQAEAATPPAPEVKAEA
jgi:chromosome segregation ATPase